MELNGGYIVHPVPVPESISIDKVSNKIDGTINQKLTLFNRGKAISGAPIKSGTNQLPNPPINFSALRAATATETKSFALG